MQCTPSIRPSAEFRSGNESFSRRCIGLVSVCSRRARGKFQRCASREGTTSTLCLINLWSHLSCKFQRCASREGTPSTLCLINLWFLTSHANHGSHLCNSRSGYAMPGTVATQSCMREHWRLDARGTACMLQAPANGRPAKSPPVTRGSSNVQNSTSHGEVECECDPCGHAWSEVERPSGRSGPSRPSHDGQATQAIRHS
jgi:hypothetical protein